MTLRLPTSGLDLRRPAEVVAENASIRVRQCHVVEVAVDSNRPDGVDFRDFFREADAQTIRAGCDPRLSATYGRLGR